MLDAARIDAALVHHGFVLGSEVLAHHANHAHIGEVAGGKEKYVAAPPRTFSRTP